VRKQATTEERPWLRVLALSVLPDRRETRRCYFLAVVVLT
jgi:hypothetical protein